VLSHGEIIEQGNHAELLAADGLYQSLHELQFSDIRAVGEKGRLGEGEKAVS
jgi:hypothetical protein